jgi:beta-glucosidase-like glycosyl hydrolase
VNLFGRTSHSKRIANFRTRMSGTGALRTRRFGSLAALLVALLAVLVAPAATAPSASASTSCPWLNQSLPVGQRLQLLMSQMTLADKINMVTGAGFSEPYVFYISGIPSLCIPPMGQEDGPLGVGDGLTGVTQMPAAVSLAATFDPSMAHRYGQVVGAEERGKGAMVNLGPTVNIDRDPRWGRSFEAFTEDPFLNGKLAVSEIDGVQSQDEMSQVKHLAVYNQETNRNTAADDAIVSQRALHEIYLPAFWAATQQAKASSAMCAYSTINGEYACQNQYLMRTTLDQRWGFPGFVTSDYQATHSTVQSADAGMDQEMPAPQYYGSALQAALQSGQVSMGTLNQMVRRILREMFRFNEFNNPPTGSTSATVTTATHQATSTKVAEAGTVLLKNDHHTLPVRSTGKSPIAVIGPGASASPTDTGGGSAYVTSTFNVPPLQGIQAAAPAGTPVNYVQGLPTDTSLAPIPSSDINPAYSTTVEVPYSSMKAAYNNIGISDNSDESAANYDGVGDSFSAQALAAGTPNALTPGGTVTIGGTTLTWPNVPAGTPDNVVTGGQTVDLSGTGTDLGFLGSSQNGTASGMVTIHYTDGSSEMFNLNMADWYANAPAVGNEVVTTTSSWNFQSNPLGPHPVSVYFASVPLEPGKTVSSVMLPVLNGAGGTTAMHIFAMAVGNGTPTMGAPYSSLAAAYDNAGISDNSDPSAANFDGTGESYSKQALAAGTPTPLTPGGQATIGGTTFTWPTPVGAPDNVIADGQIIDVSGSGTELGFLGAAGFGAASGTGTITYTDGSTQTYSISMADWYNNAPVAGDQIATTTSSWNSSSSTQVQHPVSIYYASVPLESGKTVKSVTLPTVSSGIGNGVNTMHIFAIAVGSGTPTSGSSSARTSLVQHGQRGEAHYAGQR